MSRIIMNSGAAEVWDLVHSEGFNPLISEETRVTETSQTNVLITFTLISPYLLQAVVLLWK